MIRKEDIISQLNPNVVTIHIDGDSYTCLDKDGKGVSIDLDAVNTELAKQEYKNKRAAEYPDWKSQLDYIFHNGLAKWKTDIVQPVKDKYPKP